MSTIFADESWKETSAHRVGAVSQSVARKKLEHYSYLLNDNIGKGYSSQVFRGRNDLTGEPVAVKVINMAMLKSEVHQTLLAAQIESLKQLSKLSNIIELFEVYTTKNNTYIITELCQDGDLSKLIKKKRMSETKAIGYAQQLILGYLHIFRHSIIHRDLKPANVFIKGDTLKIADFGFAVKVEDAKKNPNYNMGSPLYMPPEALTHNRYSFKSDIWALGIIFYQMLTGKAPWKAKSQQELVAKILAEPISTLIPQDASPTCVEFLLRTLNSDVAQRMSPEELQRFSFSGVKLPDLSLTTKSSTSPTQKSVLKSSQNLCIPRLDAHTPKASLHHIPVSGQKSSSQREATASISGFRVDASINGHTDRYNKKQISNQLLSEIHFCRFLYKLIVRMDQIVVPDSQHLKEQLTGLIMTKLSGLRSLQKSNGIYHLEFYKEYRDTNDLRKILNITHEYEEKYRSVLNPYITQSKDDYSSISAQVVKSILSLYRRLESMTQDNFNTFKDQIVILDYLVTTYQLVELAALKDLKEFSRKSKIQAIVNGQPTKLGFGHFRAIKEKMARLYLI